MGVALLACLLLPGSVLVWALKDVPWSEIRDGNLKPIVVLETADGGPLVRQGHIKDLMLSTVNSPTADRCGPVN